MDSAISITDLTKTFGSKVGLHNLSLEVPKGTIFGFLGPNGAGKTTLIRCLMDFIRPEEGEITILGKKATTDSNALKAQIGYLSSDVQLHPNWDGKTHIDYMAGIKGRGEADTLIKQFGLDTSKKVSHLSSGNKQKLAIILAMLGRPEILIMDEPTRGLDPLLQNQLYELLRQFTKGGGTVFLSSHNLAEVQHICDHVAVIKDGSIVSAEGMNEVLQMGVHVVQASSKKPFKRPDFVIKGVEIVSLDKHSISLKTRGDVNSIVTALHKYQLTSLEVTHASLEDVFMEYYQ